MTKRIEKSQKDLYLKQIKPFGKLCRNFKILRFYKNGTGTGMLFNYWNPLSYPIIILLVILNTILYGVVETYNDRSNLGLTMSPYFKKNPNKLYWI